MQGELFCGSRNLVVFTFSLVYFLVLVLSDVLSDFSLGIEGRPEHLFPEILSQAQLYGVEQTYESWLAEQH